MLPASPAREPAASSPPLAAGSASNAAPAARFEQLLERLRQVRPQDDLRHLRRAFEYSERLHARQKRQSGEAYIAHPLEVAHLLCDMRLDVTGITAALLHDAVEDTSATRSDIEREFGPVVGHLVEGVTKIEQLDFSSRGAAQAENMRKMLLAMVDDIRVILIKLADRLHNMRTLEHLPEEKQRRISLETMEIYAPLAHRLGMGKMRGELEDLAFAYLEPAAYQQVRQAVESKRAGSQQFLDEVQPRLAALLAEYSIPGRIEGRIKRFYSLWQKLQRNHVTVDQIYDLLAVRVITGSVKDCYAALGVIHNAWHPVPGRFKDFIAVPRPNLYQSLHTTVVHESGQPFEAQIRTEDMHRMAEEGIAAHWKYKEGGAPSPDDERIAWLRRVLEWQQEMRDPAEFLSTLKVDLYPEAVYAFTPKGQVLTLPRDATSIDFAYAIHTDVGHHCVGAKVNGRIVPLRYRIQNGDMVEIVTQPGHNPSRDWLSFVKTSRARQKIKHWLNARERAGALEIGQRALEREARRHELSLKPLTAADYIRVAQDYGYNKAEDLLAQIGFGQLSARQVLGRLLPDQAHWKERGDDREEAGGGRPSTPARPGANPILVRGFDDLMVYRARCCSPLHGEPIVGYITRGKGVAVHSEQCSNVQNLLYQADRRIDVQWAPRVRDAQPVRLRLRTDDRAGLLTAITAVISDTGANIQNIGARTGEGKAAIEAIVTVADLGQLERILANLKKIPGVNEAVRIRKPVAAAASAPDSPRAPGKARPHR